MITREFATEWKVKGDKGQFSGYASVFNNVDDGLDVVIEGAFKEFVRSRGGKVRILHHHNSREIVGMADVAQDAKGLLVEGQLLMDTRLVQDYVYPAMKAEALDAMSIGYDVLPGGATFTEAGIRRLEALKLWEVSVLPFGMNGLARIEAVKQGALKFGSIRELEDFFRDERGYSRAEAKRGASAFWKALGDRDDPPTAQSVAQLFEERLFKLE